MRELLKELVDEFMVGFNKGMKGKTLKESFMEGWNRGKNKKTTQLKVDAVNFMFFNNHSGNC